MSAVLADQAVPAALATDLSTILGRGCSTVTVAASRDPNAKVTVLILRPGASTPTLVAKVPTTAIAAGAVMAEARVLRQLAERLSPGLRASVPRVVAMLPTEHGPALVATAVPGTPMSTRYHAWRHVSRPAAVERDFASASGWLCRLQAETATSTQPVDLVAPLVGRMQRRFAREAVLEPAVDGLVALHRRLHDHHTRRTVVHGDYWPGNILCDGARTVGVIDWEGAALAGDPIRDVVRFVLAYSLYLDRHTRRGQAVAGHAGLRAGAWGAGIRFAVDGAGWFPRLVHNFTRAHLRRLGVPPERARDVLLAGIAECAVTADDAVFARRHFELLATMIRSPARDGPC